MSDSTSSGPRILLGVSGSIAAYKAVELARLLGKAGARVQVVMTQSATRFVTPLTFEAVTQRAVIVDPWTLGGAQGGEIEHVERAHDVDLAVVAPATANLMARLAAGMADDAVTATLLATRAPVCLAPAMESGMWLNPATQDNLTKLEGRGVRILGPGSGDLASGRSGVGRMLEPEAIAREVMAWARPGDLAGVGVTITAGPTWEPLDPVRILTNRSTGAMGIAIARAAAQRGAEVTLILGPTHLSPPPGVRAVRVETASQMLEAGQDSLPRTDVLVATAAVSDFRPAEPWASKLKRSAPEARQLSLAENPDILLTLSTALAGRGIVVGFAAETEAIEANARGKLSRKGCDLVIANEVGPSQGFGPGRTRVMAVTERGPAVPFGPALKDDVAQFVLDQVVRLREQGVGA